VLAAAGLDDLLARERRATQRASVLLATATGLAAVAGITVFAVTKWRGAAVWQSLGIPTGATTVFAQRFPADCAVACSVGLASLLGLSVLARRGPARATALLAASVLQPSRPVFPAPEVVRLRGDTRPQPGARGQIAQALAGTGGDFAAALPALELIAARHPESPEALICFGVALIEAGRAAEAVAPVTRARSLSQGPVADEAEWFLAVALAHSRRGREAADVLRPLCERPGERQAIACAGLRELEGVPAR
jgi:hypothetical protein